jgi:hypothetical protein
MNNSDLEHINDVVNFISLLDDEINKSFKKIDMLRKKKRDYQDKLLKICKHDWRPDRSYNNYDHTPYYCTICGLES